MAAAGAGRPLGDDGFPAGPWTAELLAQAISELDSNGGGVDLRTVQLWFQENERGISATNIRWLARVFGCDDPEATSEWQIELSAAQSRLSARRRETRRAGNGIASMTPDVTQGSFTDGVDQASPEFYRSAELTDRTHRLGLARKSEAIFSSVSPLNLPASVFAGASALGFLSYIVGIHSVTYARPDGIVKQVGFLWAPNWTFLFMVLLPLFFALVTELLVFWKTDGRLQISSLNSSVGDEEDWAVLIEAYSYSYWAVFIICVLFAGLFQWIGVCLIPLLERGDDYATSWGSLAIVRPEVISVPVSIFFTAIAYLYMCIYFYLFFVGLILLHTVVQDLWKSVDRLKTYPPLDCQREVDELGLRIMHAIFRCTILGILVAVCMKVQSSYLSSSSEDVVSWFVDDIYSALNRHQDINNEFGYRMPTHFSSLLVALSTCAVFLYGLIRVGPKCRLRMPLWKMSAIVTLLFISYLSMDAFAGSSMLLCLGVLFALYGLLAPGAGRRRNRQLGRHQSA